MNPSPPHVQLFIYFIISGVSSPLTRIVTFTYAGLHIFRVDLAFDWYYLISVLDFKRTLQSCTHVTHSHIHICLHSHSVFTHYIHCVYNSFLQLIFCIEIYFYRYIFCT